LTRQFVSRRGPEGKHIAPENPQHLAGQHGNIAAGNALAAAVMTDDTDAGFNTVPLSMTAQKKEAGKISRPSLSCEIQQRYSSATRPW
jgi:hypothetical protein